MQLLRQWVSPTALTTCAIEDGAAAQEVNLSQVELYFCHRPYCIFVAGECLFICHR